MKKMNKKGQIGETTTWIVATIIIIVILIFSVFITSILGVVGSPKRYESYKNADLIPKKSLTSFLLTPDSEGSGKKIFEKLKEDEEFVELNNENGNLAYKIFNNFYLGEYVQVWMGVDTKSFSLDAKNDYFGSRYSTLYGGSDAVHLDIIEFIFLDENKFVQLILREF